MSFASDADKRQIEDILRRVSQGISTSRDATRLREYIAELEEKVRVYELGSDEVDDASESC